MTDMALQPSSPTSSQRSQRLSIMAPVDSEMMNVTIEKHGVTEDVFNSWRFNTLKLTKPKLCAIAISTISPIHEIICGQVHPSSVCEFVQACAAGYPANPFHCFAHAVDVLHGVAKIMKLMSANTFLSDLDTYSLLIAAIAHDLGHLGVNNGFLCEVG